MSSCGNALVHGSTRRGACGARHKCRHGGTSKGSRRCTCTCISTAVRMGNLGGIRPPSASRRCSVAARLSFLNAAPAPTSVSMQSCDDNVMRLCTNIHEMLPRLWLCCLYCTLGIWVRLLLPAMSCMWTASPTSTLLPVTARAHILRRSCTPRACSPHSAAGRGERKLRVHSVLPRNFVSLALPLRPGKVKTE